MKGLPIVLDIEDKKILIIGGGSAAKNKLKNLLCFDACVSISAPRICDEILQIAAKKGIEINKEPFSPRSLDGIDIVIAAADEITNDIIYSAAKDRGILCCKSSGEKGDFVFPASKKEGRLVVSVSTNGAYPALAAKICSMIDLKNANKLDYLEDSRKRVLISNLSAEEKKAVILRLIDDKILNNENYINLIENILRSSINEGN